MSKFLRIAEEEKRRKPNDFSDEYLNLKVRIVMDKLDLEGKLLATSDYWMKLLSNDGIIYINKAHIIYIKPLESKKE
jgi:hypothetical protein